MSNAMAVMLLIIPSNDNAALTIDDKKCLKI